MTFGRDGYGIKEECAVCESPTKSHPAPNAYLCHTCVTEKDETELLDALPVGAQPEFDLDTTVQCLECDHTHTVREADTPGADVVRVGVGYPVFESFTAFVWVSCPSCAATTEYLTTADQAETLASALGIDPMSYHRRKGWSQ